MANNICIVVALLLVHHAAAVSVSPVQKVVQLLDECKAKVEKDLAAEGAAMEEYSKFCDDELKDKGYAIETAARDLADLSATVEDASAQISALSDEITTTASQISQKEGELYKATALRNEYHVEFEASEKGLVSTVDTLSRAVAVLKRGGSFMQTPQKMNAALKALSGIVDAEWLDLGSRRSLQSFLQAQSKSDEDDDLSMTQPQAKKVAYESSSGGIISTVEQMGGKAEDTLSDLRKKEMSNQHDFQMVESGLNDEIAHGQGKLSSAKQGKVTNQQSLAEATKKVGQTQKSKTADEDYAATLKGECEAKASEWAERQTSAKGETEAIAKAKEILVSGVKAFVQMSTKTQKWSPNDDDEDDKTAAARSKVIELLNDLSQTHHSFALSQIANSASSDPFGKVRGLIESMLEKLVQEANEDATHEAFCQEEMSKSSKSKEEKTATQDKLKVRIDQTASTIGQLTEAIKTLDAEMATIDAATAEATAIRNKEHSDYAQASKDFRESAEAVAHATEVLKNYYEGALIQLASHTAVKQPNFGSAKGDSSHTIIAVLEMAEEDFTALLAESESTEDGAARAYTKLAQENRVSKASKQAEARAKASEIKSLKVQLEHHKEDHASVSDELDAVLSYLDKLQPECESKAMSYAERKAAREAEIQGLKEALVILEGNAIAFVQLGRQLRHVHRA